MPRAAVLIDRRRLLDRVRRGGAPVVVFHAPPGYGKTYLARRIALEDEAHRIVDAAVEPLGGQALDEAVSLLRSSADGAFTFVLDNADALADEGPSVRSVAAVLASVEAPGRIVLCSENGFAASLTASLAPHSVEYVDRAALRFDSKEMRQLFPAERFDDAMLLQVRALTRGWPAAALFLERIWDELSPTEREAPLRSPAAVPLAHYLFATVLEPLDEQVASVLVRAIATGDQFDEAGVLTQQFQLAARDANGFVAVHPLVAWAMRTARPGPLRDALELAVAQARENGDFPRAVRLQLQMGVAPEDENSLTTSDSIAVPASVHGEVLEHFRALPRAEHPKLWHALLAARRFAVHPDALAEEAGRVAVHAPREDSWGEALAADAALSLLDTGDVDGARAAIKNVEGAHSAIVRATMATMRGAFGEAARIMETLPSRLTPLWQARRVMLLAERARAYGHWEVECERTEDLIAQTARTVPPLHVAALASALTGAWLAADEDAYRRTLARFDAAFAQTPVAALAEFAVANHGGTISGAAFVPLWSARALLVAVTKAQHPENAVAYARQALEAAERSRDLMTRILARVALAEKHPGSRRAYLAQARELASECDVPAYTDSLRALIETGDVRGALAPFVTLLRASSGTAPGDARVPLEIRLASGQVRRGESEVAVSTGGLGLLAALAVDARPVATETLCDRLWPDTPYDQAYKALKMCVHRTRTQLGDATAIETEGRGAYRLADHVAVDTRFLPRVLEGIARKQLPAHIEQRLGQIFHQLTLPRPTAFASWEWFRPTETLIQQAVHAVGLHFGTRLLGNGDLPGALAAAHELIATDPLDEAARELAIRAHIAADDRSAALSEFRRYQEVLAEELGVQPSPSLRRHIEL